MMEQIGAALVGVVIGSGLPWLAKSLLRLVRGDAERDAGELARMAARISDLEDLIDLLRRALDKHLMRESAIANAAEFIIAIVKMVQRPTAEMMHLRERAQQLLADAKAHISTINEERRG